MLRRELKMSQPKDVPIVLKMAIQEGHHRRICTGGKAADDPCS